MEKIFAAVMHPMDWPVGSISKIDGFGGTTVMFQVTRCQLGSQIDWSNAGAPLGNTSCMYAIYGVEIPAAEAAKLTWNRAKKVWE